jgi:hypothetical protein
MMGQQTVDQIQLFYLFNLEQRIPPRHLLSYAGSSDREPHLGRCSRLVGYCYGIRSEP